jgi:hypothetical protein
MTRASHDQDMVLKLPGGLTGEIGMKQGLDTSDGVKGEGVEYADWFTL